MSSPRIRSFGEAAGARFRQVNGTYTRIKVNHCREINQDPDLFLYLHAVRVAARKSLARSDPRPPDPLPRLQIVSSQVVGRGACDTL